MAIWALILAAGVPLIYVGLAVLAQAVGRSWVAVFPPALGLFGLLAIAGCIAGIIMGAAVRRNPWSTQASRGLALAAIIAGSVVLGLLVAYMLLILLFILTCLAICSSSRAETEAATLLGTYAGAVPGACPALAVPSRQGLPGRWWTHLAHHPDLPAFRADVFCVAGVRLCVGCFTAWPMFLAALGLLALLRPLPWHTLVVAGVLVGSVQLLSTAGLTKWRWLKVAVKALLATGAAAVVVGVESAPWPRPVKTAVVLGLGGCLLVSTLPRQWRIKRTLASQ